MKNFIRVALLAVGVMALLSSCEKDEGKLPDISFKTGGTYLSADATVAAGSAIVIGIEAAKTEDKDVLKKFNISTSVNGAAATSVLTQDLSGDDGDAYSYDYTTTAAATAGVVTKYTFTVTNRDGLTNQVSLTVTTN